MRPLPTGMIHRPLPIDNVQRERGQASLKLKLKRAKRPQNLFVGVGAIIIKRTQRTENAAGGAGAVSNCDAINIITTLWQRRRQGAREKVR